MKTILFTLLSFACMGQTNWNDADFTLVGIGQPVYWADSVGNLHPYYKPEIKDTAFIFHLDSARTVNGKLIYYDGGWFILQSIGAMIASDTIKKEVTLQMHKDTIVNLDTFDISELILEIEPQIYYDSTTRQTITDYEGNGIDYWEVAFEYIPDTTFRIDSSGVDQIVNKGGVISYIPVNQNKPYMIKIIMLVSDIEEEYRREYDEEVITFCENLIGRTRQHVKRDDPVYWMRGFLATDEKGNAKFLDTNKKDIPENIIIWDYKETK